MAAMTTARSSKGKMTVWNVAGQRGVANVGIDSTGHEKPYKFVFGTVSIEGDDGKRTECQLYQRGRCHYGDQCKYAHVYPEDSVQSSEITVSVPNSSRGTAGSKSAIASDTSGVTLGQLNPERTGHAEHSTSYPLRNGAADCQYYLKTGKCNYGSRCKFNHPFRDENLVNALNRRDCFDFVQRGTCPYGKSCKYNHPTSSENILNTFDNQSSSSTDSAASSRSVSRNRHRRSASEPRYTTHRETVQEPTLPTRGLLPLHNGQQQGSQSRHSTSKWETSLDARATIPKKLASDARSREIGNVLGSVQMPCVVPKAVNSAWFQNSNSMRMPDRPVSNTRNPIQRTSGSFPINSSGVRQEGHLNSSLKPSRNTPPSVTTTGMPVTQGLPRNGVPILNSWFPHSHVSNTLPFRASPVTASRTASMERAERDDTNASDLHLLQTSSIWRNDFTVRRKQNSVNASSVSFDFGHSTPQLGLAMETPGVVGVQKDDLTGLQGWSGPRPNHRRANSLSTSTRTKAIPTVPNGYSVGDSSFHGEYLQDGTRAHNLQNAWNIPNNNPIASFDLGMNMSEVQRLHQQKQLQAYQQHQYSQQKMHEQHMVRQIHQVGSYPGIGAFEYAGGQGPVNRTQEHEAIDLHQQVERNFRDLHPATNVGVESGSSTSWNTSSFDPMGYKSSLFGNESLDGRSASVGDNVWKPTDKSSIFGPGLFGMEHH